ncbi:MAG: ATP-binding protein [Candidatus Lokiarchaeota archaeon]|nr:ATP-binding protein [Candidatus Lokiarchaeota archaeon]
MLENFTYYIAEVFIFNISVIFLCSAIILYILNLFKGDKTKIDLENPSFKASKEGSVKIGRIMRGNSKKYNFSLSIKDLEKHMFICGSTGTGKSNFIQNFLINFTKHHEKPFFLVEFKGEYHFLQEKLENLIILWPGENFSINIFDPLDANPKIHAERVFDILKSGQFLDDNAEYSPQMERVLIEILTNVCENKDMQSWEGFEKNCGDYLENNKTKIPMLKQTLISLKNRIRRFYIGPMKAIFDTDTTLSISKLFTQNVILDLSSIIRLGGEKEDAIFFLNMVLKYLWDRNLTKGANNYDGINHITIIEDAQYFAPQDMSKKSKITTYLEDIALLQRGTGECLITIATRPNISKEILANNGVVLTFKNHIEKDIMCELLNLDPEKKSYLSILEEGYCIIRVNSIKEPFLLGIPFIKRGTITVSDITKKNRHILEVSQTKLDLKTEKICKSKEINKNNHSLELNNQEKEDLLHVNKNSSLGKDDYDNFNAYISKLYNDQKKNK